MDIDNKTKIALTVVALLVFLYINGVFDIIEKEEVVAPVAVEVVPSRSKLKPTPVSSTKGGKIVVIDGKNWKHWSKQRCGLWTGRKSMLLGATLKECAAECIRRGKDRCDGFQINRAYLQSPNISHCWMKSDCSGLLKPSAGIYDAYYLS